MCVDSFVLSILFFFNDTATTEIYTLSLHDALPIYGVPAQRDRRRGEYGHLPHLRSSHRPHRAPGPVDSRARGVRRSRDRKSTRLNSSHANISYAVFCLKKKKIAECLRLLAQESQAL